MDSPPKSSPEGLWLACEDMESVAKIILTNQLALFEPAIRKCYERGVQAPTLAGKRHHEPDMLLAALFLRKALNDLRATWILLRLGYTSQAASVAASLFENALTVVCLAGDTANTQRLKNQKSDHLPWSAQQLAKTLAQRWQEEARINKERFEHEDYETAWREVYSGYKWLCKIKHPTFRSAVHDASATSLTKGEYVVMAAPDMRAEDAVVKATILTIAISRIYGAVRSFVLALGCDKTSPEYEAFIRRLQEVPKDAQHAFRIYAVHPLPFDIRDSSLAEDWAMLRNQKKSK